MTGTRFDLVNQLIDTDEYSYSVRSVFHPTVVAALREEPFISAESDRSEALSWIVKTTHPRIDLRNVKIESIISGG
jgi:hypothetical protein